MQREAFGVLLKQAVGACASRAYIEASLLWINALPRRGGTPGTRRGGKMVGQVRVGRGVMARRLPQQRLPFRPVPRDRMPALVGWISSALLWGVLADGWSIGRAGALPQQLPLLCGNRRVFGSPG